MRNLVVIIFGVVLFGSCKKNDDTNTNAKPTYNNIYTSLDTSIVHYKFKVGSYWVYKNDSTAALDSVVLDSVVTGYTLTAPSLASNGYTEFYMMRMHSFGTLQYYNDYLFRSFIYRNGFWSAMLFKGEDICCTNCDTGFVDIPMKIIAKFPSMIINGNSFYNIRQSKITFALQAIQNFAHDTYLFYSPNVGLIKKEEDLGGGNIQSWSILRWHVVM